MELEVLEIEVDDVRWVHELEDRLPSILVLIFANTFHERPFKLILVNEDQALDSKSKFIYELVDIRAVLNVEFIYALVRLEDIEVFETHFDGGVVAVRNVAEVLLFILA